MTYERVNLREVYAERLRKIFTPAEPKPGAAGKQVEAPATPSKRPDLFIAGQWYIYPGGTE